jgi:hypothetical protein
VDIDLDIQVGVTNFSGEGPDLTGRYNSVIISGFLATTEIESIHQLLLTENLLPSDTLPTALLKNQKSGKITIQNLKPEFCLVIMEKMHGKSFLGRKVFVTSVVAASPKKSKDSTGNNVAVAEHEESSENKETEVTKTAMTTQQQNPDSSSNGSLVTDTNVPDMLKSPLKTSPTIPKLVVEDASNLQTSSKDSVTDLNDPVKQPISPGIQEKLDLFNMQDKRKAEQSPELSKKERKILKHQAKSAKKQEDRGRVNIILSP